MNEQAGPQLEIVVPVYNEAATLDACIRELHAYMSGAHLGSWRITIADNASTDSTSEVARSLAAEFAEVEMFRLEKKGRGHALKQAWGRSSAEVLAYLDEDLSTDLRALGPLVAPLLSGHSDLAIGTRLARSSRVVRGSKREFISRSYNLLLRNGLSVGFTDAQCGFKAIRHEVATRLLPLVQDDGWFFDTELLILAEHAGLRIHEIPVDWVDDPNSSVHLRATATADLKGIVRVGTDLVRGRLPIAEIRRDLGRDPLSREPRSRRRRIVRFGVVGVASTVLYALLYLAFQQSLSAQHANLAALLLSAVANTAANRAFTFGVRGPGKFLHQVRGMASLAVAWAITSSSLAILHSGDPAATTATSLTVLTVANLVATIVRYWLFSHWVFGPGHRDTVPAPTPLMSSIAAPAIGQKVSAR